MIKNECADIAIAELERCGLDWRMEDGGKHQSIKWTCKIAGLAVERSFTLPYTPSDWRAPLNTKSDIRKILRNDGLLDDQEQVTNNAASFERMVVFFQKKLEEYDARLRKHDGHFNSVRVRLEKVDNDIDGLMSLLNTPSPLPVIQLLAPVVEQDHTVANTGLTKVAPLSTYDADEEINYAMLEAECAGEVRLPQREGYRIIPEHYEAIEGYVHKETVVSDADVPRKRGRPRKDFSLGLKNLKDALAEARSKREQDTSNLPLATEPDDGQK